MPSTWNSRDALPLVMFLHGAGNDESSYLDQKSKQMVRLAEEHHVILVSPSGNDGAYGSFIRLLVVFDAQAEADKMLAQVTEQSTRANELSEKDVINVLELVLNEYPVDIAENRKPCSKYYQSLDTSKIDANGFSCGGLFAQGTAKDPRMTTWGLSSSGSFSDNPSLWNSVHTPVLFIEGDQDATGANTNGLRDYNGIAPLGKPVMFFSNKTMGHGGDLFSANGGDFTKIHLAWINWWLKGYLGATGKGVLVGSGCTYCTSSNWTVKSANLP